jgi:carbon-monoxide dehydrogenase small subunit
MLMSAVELLENNSNPTDDDLREAVSSNLCRCTGYQTIVEAVRSAADAMRQGTREAAE